MHEQRWLKQRENFRDAQIVCAVGGTVNTGHQEQKVRLKRTGNLQGVQPFVELGVRFFASYRH
jgi:hypothetical protein